MDLCRTSLKLGCAWVFLQAPVLSPIKLFRASLLCFHPFYQQVCLSSSDINDVDPQVINFFLSIFSQGRIKSTKAYWGLIEWFVCCYYPFCLYWRALAFLHWEDDDDEGHKNPWVLQRITHYSWSTFQGSSVSAYMTSNLQKKRLPCAWGRELWHELGNS